MALKNTKIAREIVQTCNKLLSNKSDAAPSHKASELTESNQQEYRFDVSNTSKSPLLPQAAAAKEQKQLELYDAQHLQPATYPKCIEINTNVKAEDWQLHRVNDSRKFNIKYPLLRTISQRFSRRTVPFKRNLINRTTNIVDSRNYSTSPFMIVSRGYATRGQKDDKCDPPKKKNPCPKGPCPSFALDNCVKSPGSDCDHAYIDPKCTKKLAPYPSYSETCAQQLEDDPSECFQCPWDKCGGVDAIKPPKRKYHTSARPYSSAPSRLEYGLTKDCDAKKKPCKAPPPKCQTDTKKKDDCPGAKPPGKRRCDSTWTEAYHLWSSKEAIIPSVSLPILTDIKEAKKGPDVRGKFPFDPRQANYDYLKEKSCPADSVGCKKPKYKRVPDSCIPEAFKRNCISNMAQTILYDLKKCPTPKPKCPPKDKQKCPEVDKTIDKRYKPRDPCCSEAKKSRTVRRHKARVFVPEKRNY